MLIVVFVEDNFVCVRRLKYREEREIIEPSFISFVKMNSKFLNNLRDNTHLPIQLLGREVYSSNSQLGGVQIMHNNGVSHDVAPNDLEGIHTMLRWLSFIPKVLNFSFQIFQKMLHFKG